MDELGKAFRQARRKGAGPTQQVSRAIFGMRHDLLRPYVSDASHGQRNVSAIGIGPRSVWIGPAEPAQPGEPCLRRARP